VHELRTGARNLETAFVTLGLDSKRGIDSLRRDLEKIRRLAGSLRDMDVLTAAALNVDRRGEQDCLVRLLESLGAERSKRARKLRAAIAKRRRRFLRSLERGLDRVERATEDADTVPGAVARAVQVSSKLSRPGRLTRKNLHEYRLEVKKLRDILRLSDRAADVALVPKLEEVKDAIGDWHDWVELTDVALDVLDHGASCQLTKRLAATRDTNYKRALSLTHALIARHLRPKRRKHRRRSAVRAPIAKPVLEAVAAIAEADDPERS
jgi:CHAD domain-containing protein